MAQLTTCFDRFVLDARSAYMLSLGLQIARSLPRRCIVIVQVAEDILILDARWSGIDTRNDMCAFAYTDEME